jgi:hypothetical protein
VAFGSHVFGSVSFWHRPKHVPMDSGPSTVYPGRSNRTCQKSAPIRVAICCGVVAGYWGRILPDTRPRRARDEGMPDDTSPLMRYCFKALLPAG